MEGERREEGGGERGRERKKREEGEGGEKDSHKGNRKLMDKFDKHTSKG